MGYPIARVTTGDTGNLTGTVNTDLTGATATLHCRRPDRTTFTLPATLNADQWTVTYDATHFPHQGLYACELQVTYSNQNVQTFARNKAGTALSILASEEIA